MSNMIKAPTSIFEVETRGFLFGLVAALYFLVATNQAIAQTGQDLLLDSVAADLHVPAIENTIPSAGKRVLVFESSKKRDGIYCSLYLPTDWQPSAKFPLLVEFGGNQHRGKLGDVSTGLPEDCSLGYGLSAGVGCIWISMPYLDNSGTKVTPTWWGDPPNYNPNPTLDYCIRTIDLVCDRYGADRTRIVLCGFSRGAIACNYLGLRDEKIASIWKGFFVYSHYDGVREWPFSKSDSSDSGTRLHRLKGRKQFVCDEDPSRLKQAETLISNVVTDRSITFQTTGFQNHSDKWILRPSSARERARQWLTEVLQDPASSKSSAPP